jgi:hypothetical protein
MANIDLPKPPPVRFVVVLGLLSFVIFMFSWMYTDHNGQPSFAMRDSASTVLPTMGMPSPGVSYGGSGGVAVGPAYQDKMMAYDEGASYVDEFSMPMPKPPTEASTPPVSANKVIRSANLALLVTDTDEVARGIREIRIRYNGQPGNEQFGESRDGMRSGTMTIWVPTEHFDAALHDIKVLALRVNTENVSVMDVSTQFTDLESQLRNQKAAEAQYLEIMKRSGKVSEVLQVAQALIATRQQIEYIQGQLNQLSTQIALSSINVSLTPEAKPGQVAGDWRPGTVAKDALKMLVGELTGFANVLIVAVIGLPGLMLELAFFGFVLWLLVRLGKWIYRKVDGKSLPIGKGGV